MSSVQYSGYVEYRCSCAVPGLCWIHGNKPTLLTCGVIGLINIQDARVVDGVVSCANCGKVIYECER